MSRETGNGSGDSMNKALVRENRENGSLWAVPRPSDGTSHS
jgi:hypothetical protein